MAEVTRVELSDFESSGIKSTEVEKLVDLQFDVGTLLAIDINDLDLKKLRSGQVNEYFKSLARDNTQLLINEIWKLPTDRVDEAIVAKLPPCTYVLPREKPVPKPKPLTKWQQYVKDKGLKVQKKSNLTWDDILKKWVPRHGYKKAAAEKEKNWVIEVPQNVDPFEDMFKKQADAKKEKVSKNEFQRLRNLAKAKNIKVPSMGLPPTEKLSSLQLNSAASIANVSTASLGKFQQRLPKEKKLSEKSILQKKKRKLDHRTVNEHKSNLSIMDKIVSKKPRLNVPEETVAHQARLVNKKSSKKKGGEGKKKGGKKSSFGSNTKPTNRSMGGGKHKNFKAKGTSGRKRR